MAKRRFHFAALLATAIAWMLGASNEFRTVFDDAGFRAASVAAAEPNNSAGNRMRYLSEPLDPYYPHRDFPKLTTPQWVGEPGVECVVTLGIDDMRDPEKYETFFRPILERLKKIDGRAPVSVMTCQVDPRHPRVAQWLAEGLSIECHTIDHPCPCLQGGDFAKAKSTYERCVDLISQIPGNKPVAFRMPCCDSLNTPSPRFWAEIFSRSTASGRFLQIDTSVFNVITAQDESLPAEIRCDAQGRSRFARYIPFPSFVNTIDDYPYPYVIGNVCWEFPCVVPSDWSAQFVQKPNNPDTVRDLKLALDACVLKQGVFNLVFHPHGWIRSEQIVELIDHAQQKHGSKIKFLTFPECLERLNKNLLRGTPLRATDGADQGIRLVDLDGNGRMDVLRIHDGAVEMWSGEPEAHGTPARRVAWPHAKKPSKNSELLLVAQALASFPADGRRVNPLPPWQRDEADVADLSVARRYCDLDGDGVCELITSRASGSSVVRWDALANQWRDLPFGLPAGVRITDDAGRDAGFRVIDVNGDGRDDLLFSSEHHYSLHLFRDLTTGWSVRAIEGVRGESSSTGPTIPVIARGDGTNNGAWFHSRHLWIQNEDTQRLPNLVDRLAFDDMTHAVREREATAKLPAVPIGAAKVDISPTFPVRLSGYSNRKTEATKVTHKLWAKALAIGGDDGDGPALLLTLDNCGLTPAMRDAVVQGLRDRNIKNERVVITASHTHTAPCLTNWAPYLFGEDLPAEHQKHIDDYTAEVTRKLIEAAHNALAARRPGRLAWGQGKVGFAANRRVLKEGKWTGFGVQADGPVDHSLPVLAARDESGKLIAVVANYACHCTTLGGDFNEITGDWAGFAQDFIEQDHPGCVALTTIGCGADANPEPRRNEVELCRQHGRTLATEVKRLLAGELTPLDPRVECRLRTIELPFDALPTKEQWQERAKQAGAPGYHAKQFLAKRERGEKIPEALSYPVATWAFGKDLAMVFLGGEVVVDYAIRFKTEFDAARLWVTAYANDVCCYIASKRVLREGGYEADFSMYFYARPTRWTDDVEDQITDTVQKLLPRRFYAKETQTSLPPPKSPAEALASIRVKQGYKVELVAAEPLVEDPVAFDWAPDGSLWVVEMRDYPNGLNWNGPEDPKNQPGGRVKVLRDTNGDGRYDQAKIFLDRIPFPNGIKVWRRGVLVTCAPRVVYAEDHDGDDRADELLTVLDGFVEGNQQHRMNGLRWGLDGWLYLANGDSGGRVRLLEHGLKAVQGLPRDKRLVEDQKWLEDAREFISISGRDLRFHPQTGRLEAIAGQTQFGRNRDDWDNWFGGNNANPMWHYVLDEGRLSRNPYVAPPDNRKHVSVQPGASPVFPLSRTLERFNDFNMSNRFTSACSPEPYRDVWLFGNSATAEDEVTHAFICEPVHNLVHHERMTRDGVSFTSRRLDDEAQSEFFASTDNWSRPVMARTGPDGALWIADMYRAVIEHPEWIPRAWQRKLDLTAGNNMGRIYRIVRDDASVPKIQRLDRHDLAGLVAALDSTNGTQRDLAQQMLLWSTERDEVKRLEAGRALIQLARTATRPATRAQAWATLTQLDLSNVSFDRDAWWETRIALVNDPHPEVRRTAIRLSGPLAEQLQHPKSRRYTERLLSHRDDPSLAVVVELAYGLDGDAPEVVDAWAHIARKHADNPYVTAAILSAVNKPNAPRLFAALLAQTQGNPPRRLFEALLATIAGFEDRELLADTVRRVAPAREGRYESWQLAGLASILDATARLKNGVDPLLNDATRSDVVKLFAFARSRVLDTECAEAERLVALRLLGRGPDQREEDCQTLVSLLSPKQSQSIQLAAAAALVQLRRSDLPARLLEGWTGHGPALRTQILDALVAREDWTLTLLGQIEQGTVPASQIDARRRQQFLSHKNEAIRNRSEKLFASAGSESRQKVLDRYRPALALAADAARGKQVFTKRCAVCHRLDGVGHLVGPDLAAVGNKAPDALLIAMFDPNRAIEDRYLDYLVITEDGRTLTGLLGSETATSVTLVGQESKTQVILRSAIDEMRSTGKSLMPEGLEKELSPQDVADVIAYVRGTTPPPKMFPGNKPEVVRGDDNGALRLLATTARIYGPTLVFEEQYRNLGWWSSADDYAAWTIEVPRAGRYSVSLDYACDNSAAGGRFTLNVGDQSLGGVVEGTGTWDTYRTKTIGVVELRAGPNELVMRAADKISSALIDLRGVRLIPVK